MEENTNDKQRPYDRTFSLGLSYNDIMNLQENQLDIFLENISREEILDWLQWNDPNGIYNDISSMIELGDIVGKEEGPVINYEAPDFAAVIQLISLIYQSSLSETN